jgi:hypothetical protein
MVHDGARSLPLHAHERAYLCLLLDGSYEEEVARKLLSYRPMSLGIHPAEVEHRDRVGARGGLFFTLEAEHGFPAPAGPALLHGDEALWPMLRLHQEFRRWDHAPQPSRRAWQPKYRLSSTPAMEQPIAGRPPG